MTIGVTKLAEATDFEIVAPKSTRESFVQFMTNMEPCDGGGPKWGLRLVIGKGQAEKAIVIELAPFITASDCDKSATEPISIMNEVAAKMLHGHVFLFQNRFFLSERPIKSPQEHEEVVLRIKKTVYDEEGELNSLRSYVANVEAAIEYQRSGPRREPIPDDVKLVVWSRDGGRCTRCGSNDKLHFDHIIPVIKGGGNGEANIQLLCQTCNLKKSDRIAF